MGTLYNLRARIRVWILSIMSQNPKKSASNNVRLFDQLTLRNLELSDLIEDLNTPAQSPDAQSTSPESIQERLDRLESLVIIEQSLLQRPMAP